MCIPEDYPNSGRSDGGGEEGGGELRPVFDGAGYEQVGARGSPMRAKVPR